MNRTMNVEMNRAMKRKMDNRNQRNQRHIMYSFHGNAQVLLALVSVCASIWHLTKSLLTAIPCSVSSLINIFGGFHFCRCFLAVSWVGPRPYYDYLPLVIHSRHVLTEATVLAQPVAACQQILSREMYGWLWLILLAKHLRKGFNMYARSRLWWDG